MGICRAYRASACQRISKIVNSTTQIFEGVRNAKMGIRHQNRDRSAQLQPSSIVYMFIRGGDTVDNVGMGTLLAPAVLSANCLRSRTVCHTTSQSRVRSVIMGMLWPIRRNALSYHTDLYIQINCSFIFIYFSYFMSKKDLFRI